MVQKHWQNVSKRLPLNIHISFPKTTYSSILPLPVSLQFHLCLASTLLRFRCPEMIKEIKKNINNEKKIKVNPKINKTNKIIKFVKKKNLNSNSYYTVTQK